MMTVQSSNDEELLLTKSNLNFLSPLSCKKSKNMNLCSAF